MATEMIEVIRCDCCGLPLPVNGYEYRTQKDGSLLERRATVLHGNWALSNAKEDWLCPSCDDALMVEVRKLFPYHTR